MKYLSIILLFTYSIGFGQSVKNPLIHYSFDNTLIDSTLNGYNGTITGSLTFSTTAKLGSHSLYSSGGSGKYVSIPTVDLGNQFYVSFWARNSSTLSAAQYMFSLVDAADYFMIYGTATNIVRTISTSFNTAGNPAWTVDQWNNILVNIDNSTGKCRIYVNGSRAGQTDSTITSSIGTNDDYRLFADYYGNDGFQGYIDEVRIGTGMLSTAQVDSIYNLTYITTPEFSYDPVTGRDVLFYKNGIQYQASKNGQVYYTKIGVPNDQPSDQIIYFFENFEDLADANYSTVSELWHSQQSQYINSTQSIYNYGGAYGDVFRSIYYNGDNPGDAGYEIYCYFEEPVRDQICINEDVWCDPGWDGDGAVSGYNSGKLFDGFHGGAEPISYFVDTTATGRDDPAQGFNAASVWGSSNSQRGYFWMPNQTDQVQLTVPGWVAPQGTWVNYKACMVPNTPGQADGVFIIYLQDTIAAIKTDMYFQSYSQSQYELNYFDAFKLKYMFGGSGSNYASTRDNYIYKDNIMVWSFAEDSPYRWDGTQEVGDAIVGPDYPSTSIYQQNMMSNRTYTASSGTFADHDNSSYYVPDGDGSTVYSSTINSPAGDIDLVFTRYNNGYTEGDGTSRESYIKIYDIESGESLLYWFQEAGVHDGEPTVGATIHTNSTDIRIDYYQGSDFNGGWEISYTTN